MSLECRRFRGALEAELLGRPSREKLAWLSWHEHLLSCGACRELLDREEALEVLLASLPEPRLPAEMARRVLVRLREDRTVEVRLDALLDLDPEARAPERLASEVLAALAEERETHAPAPADARLEALLDLDRAIDVPPGLASRVLSGLAAERGAPKAPARPIWRSGWAYAAAAGILLALLGRAFWLRASSRPGREPEPVVRTETDPDPRMLAALDVLEEWDLLMQDDIDVLLSTLAPADEALLEYR